MKDTRIGLIKLDDQMFKTRLIERNDKTDALSFEKALKDAMVGVNDLQMEADVMIQKLSLGDVDDVSEVSVSVEKAELAFKLLVQIRDKLIDAYQQLGRMPV
ncbi:MAG: flagellar hook-basal body complex protein FliE [Dethiosulfovibrio peptidovorans]|nr:MAG: flagellar hook-basal body complex protein FliE [Dethiosulfovibrio peptidovorans]